MKLRKFFMLAVAGVAAIASGKAQSIIVSTGPALGTNYAPGVIPTDPLEKIYQDFKFNANNRLSQNFAKGKLATFDALGGTDRYFSNSWVVGGAINGSNVLIKDNLKFNFDFKEHELYAQFKDTAMVLDNANLNAFYLYEKGVPHYFTKMPAIDNQHFFEELGNYDVNDAALKGKIKLLKVRTMTIHKGDKSSVTAAFTGDTADDISNKTEYYVCLPDETITKVKLNKKAFSAALGKYSEKAQKFFSGDDGSFDEGKAISLLAYLNQ